MPFFSAWIAACGSTDGAPVADGNTHLRDGAQTLIAEALHEDQVPVRFSLEQIWGAQAML